MTDNSKIIHLYPDKIIYFKPNAPRPEEFTDHPAAEFIERKNNQVYVRFIRDPGLNTINVHFWIPLDLFDLD